jgi:hypothetical protein
MLLGCAPAAAASLLIMLVWPCSVCGNACYVRALLLPCSGCCGGHSRGYFLRHNKDNVLEQPASPMWVWRVGVKLSRDTAGALQEVQRLQGVGSIFLCWHDT